MRLAFMRCRLYYCRMEVKLMNLKQALKRLPGEEIISIGCENAPGWFYFSKGEFHIACASVSLFIIDG